MKTMNVASYCIVRKNRFGYYSYIKLLSNVSKRTECKILKT